MGLMRLQTPVQPEDLIGLTSSRVGGVPSSGAAGARAAPGVPVSE